LADGELGGSLRQAQHIPIARWREPRKTVDPSLTFGNVHADLRETAKDPAAMAGSFG
jgi:hypothetical protein